jgi:hypothetical protein
MHRLPFQPRTRPRNNPLKRLQSDLCELAYSSLGDGRHILTFVDDYTHYLRIYNLPNKTPTTVLSAFKDFDACAERQSGIYTISKSHA